MSEGSRHRDSNQEGEGKGNERRGERERGKGNEPHGIRLGTQSAAIAGAQDRTAKAES